RCTQCGEVRPLETFRKDKRKRDGRDSRCRVCDVKRKREARWVKQGIPASQWQRLHQEADRKAEARADRPNSVPDGFRACARCGKVKPLEEFSPYKRALDGRYSWCRVCKAKYDRERRWTQKGIPESEWS